MAKQTKVVARYYGPAEKTWCGELCMYADDKPAMERAIRALRGGVVEIVWIEGWPLS